MSTRRPPLAVPEVLEPATEALAFSGVVKGFVVSGGGGGGGGGGGEESPMHIGESLIEEGGGEMP